MNQQRSQSDLLEERLIEFAARIIQFSAELPKTPSGRHIALQILRSGTAAASNYAEARGAESRADFIHKLGIVQKELNETSIWLRIIQKSFTVYRDFVHKLIAENKELCKILVASIQTAKRNESAKPASVKGKVAGEN